jgi:predicted RNA binding protein YcfA (HicA-like mRNA interferase family)
MQGLPVVSGKKLVKTLYSLGYEVRRQKGSHIQMRLISHHGEHTITIPLHDEITPGTLNDILQKVSGWTGISRSEIIALIRDS